MRLKKLRYKTLKLRMHEVENLLKLRGYQTLK